MVQGYSCHAFGNSLPKVNNIPCYKVRKNKFFLTNDFKFIYVFIVELLSAVCVQSPSPCGYSLLASRGRVFNCGNLY